MEHLTERSKSQPITNLKAAGTHVLGSSKQSPFDSAKPRTMTPLQKAYQNQKDSVFFGKFPAEIRNKIYMHLLVCDVTIDTRQILHEKSSYYEGIDEKDNVAVKRPDGAIARACRATVYEAYPILYGRNTFLFLLARDIEAFQNGRLGLELDGPSIINIPQDPHPRVFGTDLIAGPDGRLSLIREVELSVKKFGVDARSRLRMGMLSRCWDALVVLPILEHVYLDFRNDYCSCMTAERVAKLLVTTIVVHTPMPCRKLTLKVFRCHDTILRYLEDKLPDVEVALDVVAKPRRKIGWRARLRNYPSARSL